MDTERYFKATEENLNSIANYLEGTKEELKVIIDYVELMRHMQEIHQWYDIFVYSRRNLKNAVLKKDKIGINVYLISLISAGKTIADSVTLCIKNNLEEECLFIRNEYDSNFSYKFLIRLRNYSQHGHIPVSIIEGQPRFDLLQIYNTPHYDFNSNLKKDVDEFIEFIHENQESIEGPMLSFESTVVLYTCSIFRIYKKFLEKIWVCVAQYWSEIQLLIKEKPEMIKHNDKKMDGLMFYVIKDIDEENMQAVDIVSDPNKLITLWENDVIAILKDETRIVKEMKKRSLTIGDLNKHIGV